MTSTLNEKAARAGNLAAQDPLALVESLGEDFTKSAHSSQDKAEQSPADPQPNHLAFWAKKGSAAAAEFKVESTKKKLDAIGARWKGGKWNEVTGRFQYPDRAYRSILLERKPELYQVFEERGVSREDIEQKPVYLPPPPPKYRRKAERIEEEVAGHRAEKKELEMQMAKEIDNLERLNREGTIAEEDLDGLIQKVQEKYQPRIEALTIIAAKKEDSESKILLEGEPGAGSESLLAPFTIEDLKKGLEDNEVGDAALFKKISEGNILYDPDEKSFYLWSGSLWVKDAEFHRRKLLTDLAEIYGKSADIVSETDACLAKQFRNRAKALKAIRRQNAVLEMSQVGSYEKNGMIFIGEWDNHPRYILCANGLLKIDSGDLLNPERGQFIRKASKIRFNQSVSDDFHKFVIEIMNGSVEMANFLRRFFGYASLGNPVEDRFLFLYGQHGRNGKGTLVRCVSSVLGDLARTLSPELILLQRTPSSSSMPRPDLVYLKGTRLAIFSEINKGRQIDSATLKNLTGRDIIAARFLYSNDVKNFSPTHTIVLQANHKPKAPSEDHALWYRALLVPFELSFVDEPREPHERKVDRYLEEKLLANPSGILQWLIEGARDYQKNGLSVPSEISQAVESYRQENDAIGLFINEHCERVKELSTPCKKLRDAIRDFANSEGLNLPSPRDVTAYLTATGCRKYRSKTGDSWMGISIRPQEE